MTGKSDRTRKVMAVLYHAKAWCMCDSYYAYKCGKCTRAGKGFLTDSHSSAYKEALEEEWVEWRNDARGLQITKKGEQILKDLNGDFT